MLNTGKSDLKLNLHYSLLQANFWFLLAAETIFSVALLRERGFANEEIGMILAAKYFAAVISQMLISVMADRYRGRLSLKRIICLLSALSFAMTLIFYSFQFGFWGTLATFAVFGGTINGIYPYINAMAPRFTEAGRKVYYSFARGVGSLAWGIAGMLLSFSVNRFTVESILVFQAVFAVLIFIMSATMEPIPHTAAVQNEKNSKTHSYLFIFRNYPGYTLFLIASLLLFVSYTLETTFILDIVSKAGGGNMELGYVTLVQSLCEIPPAFLFVALRKKFHVRNLLRICAIFAFFHALATCISFHMPALILAQLPQILGIGLFWAASVEFVCLEIPEQDWVKGQALVNICSLGVSGIIGCIISGDIMSRLGITGLMTGATIISGIGAVIMYAAMKKTQGNMGLRRPVSDTK